MRGPKAVLGLLALAVAGPMCGGGGGGGGGGGAPAGGGTFSVLTTSPANGITGVGRTSTIYLTVNGIVDPATLTGNVTVLGNPNPVPATLTYNAIHSAIEIRPNTPFLSRDFIHTVTIGAGVKTIGGASMVPASFTFRTVDSADTTLPTFGGVTLIDGLDTRSMTVRWNPGSDDVTAVGSLLYDVYLATTAGAHNFGSAPAATSLPGANSVTFNNTLSPNTPFFVIVRCRDGAENQEPNGTVQNAKTHVSFSTNIYAPIIQPICQACHVPGHPDGFGFMDLSVPASDVVNLRWVNVPADMGAGPPQLCQSSGFLRVVPGNPAASLVYRKISETTPPCGMQMPEGGPFLPPDQQALFFDWITQGANDN